MQTSIQKAGVLIEAIPYIHKFRRKVFVVKYGGSILDDPEIRLNVFQDLVFLSYVGIRTILVHGGGPHISRRLESNGIKPNFRDGIRVTDEATLEIVYEELEILNNKIVDEIRALKGDVTGMHGAENIVHVEKKNSEHDLGFVGEVTSIDKTRLNDHLKAGHITVISPIGISAEQQAHNINADEVASAIASSMDAEKLVYLTNTQGVLTDMDDESSLLSTLTVKQAHELVRDGVIKGGMIPKVLSSVATVQAGVRKTHIINAAMEHALLLEIFTNQGIGTEIIP